MISPIVLAMAAAYLGVGGLVVHETEMQPADSGWRGQSGLFWRSLVIAVQWPRVAWQILAGRD